VVIFNRRRNADERMSRPGARPCLLQPDGRGLRWNEHVQALARSRPAVEVTALAEPGRPAWRAGRRAHGWKA